MVLAFVEMAPLILFARHVLKGFVRRSCYHQFAFHVFQGERALEEREPAVHLFCAVHSR